MTEIPSMREMMDRLDETALFEADDVVHYELDRQEHLTDRGGRYVDPDLYKKGHRDYHPAMKCQTGNGHAKGTRDWSQVTCPRCLAKR